MKSAAGGLPFDIGYSTLDILLFAFSPQIAKKLQTKGLKLHLHPVL
jgi:hypothetical protein